MPFAITCPKCAAQFRSSKERPIGKGVQCPKCSEQFYISADNQEELSAGPPPVLVPKRRPRDDDGVELDDAPRSRKPRDDDDDDGAPRARKPRAEDSDDDVDLDDRPRRRSREDDDDRPRGNRGRGKALVLALCLAGLVVLIGGGAGAYLLFFSGGGSAEHKVPPPRDLDMELLAYTPTQKAEVLYCDYKMVREKDYRVNLNVGVPDLNLTLPRGSGIADNQIAALCIAKARQQDPQIISIRFNDPQDVAQVAARCKFAPLPAEKPGVYTNQEKVSDTWILYQPDPARLVFVREPFREGAVDRVKLTRLALHPVGLSDAMQKGLKLVSGYPNFSGRETSLGGSSPSHLSFVGEHLDAQNVRERYSVEIHPSESEAQKEWKRISGGKGGKGALEETKWTKGDTIFRWERRQSS
jgi:predicted Zn finger-like uncharacterized protein